MKTTKTFFYVIFYVMSIGLITSLWIPFIIENKKIISLSEKYHSDFDDSVRYGNTSPFTPDSLINKNDTLAIRINNTTITSIPEVYGSENRLMGFLSFIKVSIKHVNELATFIITIFNIPVAYNHYKEYRSKREK